MLGRLRRALLAADPGLQRTYTAGRTTLSAAGALALIFPLAKSAGQPPTVALLGVSVAMISAAAIAGPTRRAQLKAAGLAAATAGAAVTLGALVVPYPLLSYAAFVLVMAAAAWGGGFGPRGIGLGMVGFMTFFFALFTQASLARLPWLLLSVALGIAVSAAMRILILRDRPDRRLRRLLHALRARTATLQAHAERVRTGASGRGDARATLADDSLRVDEVVLPLHDLLRDAPGVVARGWPFQRHLFAVVTLSHLLILRALEGRDATQAALALPPVDPADRLRAHLDALEAAADGRPEPALPGARELIDIDPEIEAETEAESPADPQPLATPPLWKRGAGRTALQVAAAGAVAIAIGHLLSPHRWYWAAIAAYIVFVNTGSRGVTLRRAVERTLGTAAGIALGMLAASFLAGRSAVELAAIFPLLFVAFWFAQASQVTMVGMMTILFALMYDLMGMLTLHVMLLRLAETMVGAAAGAIAAYFIFPARTGGAVEKAFDGFFGAMDDLLATAVAAPAAAVNADRAMLDGVRGLDRAVGSLRGAVLPVITSVPGRRSRALRRELVLALAARHWLHRLVGRILFHTSAVDADELQRRGARVRERIARLRDGAAPDDPPRDPGDATEAAPLVRVESILAELARARAERP